MSPPPQEVSPALLAALRVFLALGALEYGKCVKRDTKTCGNRPEYVKRDTDSGEKRHGYM